VEIWVIASTSHYLSSFDPQMISRYLTAKRLYRHLNSLYAVDDCGADPEMGIKYSAS
jgi:hypothetical protein